jgi:hypothetical protein
MASENERLAESLLHSNDVVNGKARAPLKVATAQAFAALAVADAIERLAAAVEALNR